MKELIDLIRDGAKQAQFVSLRYTTKKTVNKFGVVTKGGETARYTLILGATYQKLLEKSVLALELTTDEELENIAKQDGTPGLTLPVMQAAKKAVLDSLNLSIESHKNGQQNPNYTKAGQYINLGNGLNLNEKDLTLQLFGLEQSKVILEQGVYRAVKSAIETIAKNAIRETLPVSRFKEFALDVGNIHGVKMNGEVLEIE